MSNTDDSNLNSTSTSTSSTGVAYLNSKYKSFPTMSDENSNDDWRDLYISLKKEYEELQGKYEDAMRSISCLQQDKAKLLRFMLERRKQLKGGRGKNTVNVTELNNDCPENGSNYSAVSKFVLNKLFRTNKFLKPGWDEWSTTPQTVCHGVTSLILYPKELNADYKRQLYWREVLVPMVNKKMSSIKGNITQSMKKIYMGKSLFEIIVFLIELM